jgi:hypothetical protein
VIETTGTLKRDLNAFDDAPPKLKLGGTVYHLLPIVTIRMNAEISL